MAANPHYYRSDGPFHMLRGGVLEQLTLAYETWGALNPDASNAVLLMTGMSPSAHAASNEHDDSPGWWEAIVGPGKAIDTNRFFVICVNSLGSCFGSTGPASIDPNTNERYGPDFPELSIEDIAAGCALVLDHLGIRQLHSVVGPSMGGMTALALLLQRPGIARHFLSLSSAVHSEPFATAIRSLQREAIWSDPAYKDGRYAVDAPPATGMRLARKLGMISYRSAQEWRTRFARDRIDDRAPDAAPFAPRFQIESYLEAHAERFVGSFDANCYLWLSRAMDWFDPVADSSLIDAVTRTRVQRTTIVGVTSDILFPIHQQREIAAAFADAGIPTTFAALESVQGHDSFLVDIDRFAPVIAEAMD